MGRIKLDKNYSDTGMRRPSTRYIAISDSYLYAVTWYFDYEKRCILFSYEHEALSWIEQNECNPMVCQPKIECRHISKPKNRSAVIEYSIDLNRLGNVYDLFIDRPNEGHMDRQRRLASDRADKLAREKRLEEETKQYIYKTVKEITHRISLIELDDSLSIIRKDILVNELKSEIIKIQEKEERYKKKTYSTGKYTNIKFE